MKVVIHTPILISALLLFSSQPVLAAALDKSIKNILKKEASETSLVKGANVQEAEAEPTIVPSTDLDFQQLENSIKSQIESALVQSVEKEVSSVDAKRELEAALESVVSSALLKGNNLDDIKDAVASAMSEIQSSDEIQQEVPVENVETAAVALKGLVSEVMPSEGKNNEEGYIESLKVELNEAIEIPTETKETVVAEVANTNNEQAAEETIAQEPIVDEPAAPVIEEKVVKAVNTMSAVDTILAAMPATNEKEPEVSTPKVEVAVVEEEKPEPKPEPKPEEELKTTVTISTTSAQPEQDLEAPLQTVTVLQDETLSKISQRVYGTGNRYLDLYEANKDTIDNPDIIRAGQVLKVPR